MVDVNVVIGLPENADVADAYDARETLIKDTREAKLDVMPLMRATPVSGSTLFDPLVADQTFEAKNTRDAHIAVGLIAASLLRQGFTVKTISGKLLRNASSDTESPEPGVAHIEIVAPLGQG